MTSQRLDLKTSIVIPFNYLFTINHMLGLPLKIKRRRSVKERKNKVRVLVIRRVSDRK